MSFRWLLAAALITASGKASANTAAPAARPQSPAEKLTGGLAQSQPDSGPKDAPAIETENYTVSSDGETIIALPDAHGNPVLFTQGARLEASRILLNRKTKSASAEGEVKVDFAGLRILADGANYRSELRRLETGRVRMGKPPILVEADKISVETAMRKVETSV
ncbi:MAG: hypothetical protein RJA21_731, partial [Gemmatimonadota bacterium]